MDIIDSLFRLLFSVIGWLCKVLFQAVVWLGTWIVKITIEIITVLVTIIYNNRGNIKAAVKNMFKGLYRRFVSLPKPAKIVLPIAIIAVSIGLFFSNDIINAVFPDRNKSSIAQQNLSDITINSWQGTWQGALDKTRITLKIQCTKNRKTTIVMYYPKESKKMKGTLIGNKIHLEPILRKGNYSGTYNGALNSQHNKISGTYRNSKGKILHFQLVKSTKAFKKQ
ncbi:MAG: hypothetical protein LBR81_01985 [Prevotellaceae bacterium]|jgi:hypothetical protein|nr:hypothetical protein [Prevotellaceae bacterium]